jgi:hypothetical protein
LSHLIDQVAAKGKDGKKVRKSYKKKSRSLCAICKSYKTGGAKRWDERELAKREQFEKEKREYEGQHQC